MSFKQFQLPIDSQRNMQMSKAALVRFCLLPSIKQERHFIKEERVFQVNCMIPAATFWMSAAKSLIERSAMEAFLSQQYSEATKQSKGVLMKLISQPQLQEKEVRTSWAEFLMQPISVDAFLMSTGKKAQTAFSTLICWPASKSSLMSLNMFFTRSVFPVLIRSRIVGLNLQIMSGMYSEWNLLIFLNSVMQLKLSYQLCPFMQVQIKAPVVARFYTGASCSKATSSTYTFF